MKTYKVRGNITGTFVVPSSLFTEVLVVAASKEEAIESAGTMLGSDTSALLRGAAVSDFIFKPTKVEKLWAEVLVIKEKD